MADPKMLYAVVSVVFAGLAVWLAFVFRTVKEPWAAEPVQAASEPAKAEAPTVPAAEDEDDEDDEDDEADDDAEGEQVTVKNEVATEEAIEKAKKA